MNQGPNAGQMLHSWSEKSFNEDEIQPRKCHLIVLDKHRMYSWGGLTPTDLIAPIDIHEELLEFNFITRTWSKLTTTGQCPMCVDSPNAIIINRHLFHLDAEPKAVAIALFDLDLDTLKWSWIRLGNQENAPSDCYFKTRLWVGDYLYMVGDDRLNRLNLKNHTWEPPIVSDVSEGRSERKGVHFNGKLYMIGEKTFNEIESFDIVSHQWKKVCTKTSTAEEVYPSSRDDFSCHLVVDSINKENADIYMIGGKSSSKVEEDLWRLNLSSMQWIRLSPSLRLPVPVYYHGSAMSSDGFLCIFGGFTADGMTNSLQTESVTVPSLQVVTWQKARAMPNQADKDKIMQRLLETGMPPGINKMVDS